MSLEKQKNALPKVHENELDKLPSINVLMEGKTVKSVNDGRDDLSQLITINFTDGTSFLFRVDDHYSGSKLIVTTKMLVTLEPEIQDVELA